MNVVVIIVIRRSRSCSIVREAIMPGTPQPIPISIGMNDLPDNPKRRKIRSMINATRAIYPQSSNMDSIRNSTSICGTKPITEPAPPTIPSTISPVSQPAVPIPSRNPCTAGFTHSLTITSFVKSVSMPPTVVTAI